MHQPLTDKNIVITIQKNMSSTNIALLLAKKTNMKYPYIWNWYGRITGWSKKLQAGEYFIKKNSNGIKLFKLLSSNQVIQHRLILIPGMTIDDIKKTIANQPEIHDDLATFSVKSLKGCNYGSLEGLFYPDTYFYVAGSKASIILIKAYQKMQTVLNKAWQNRTTNLPYKNPYEALIMASIIEKETAIPKEKAKIASVFIQRLLKKMRLQSDPTVIYGMGSKYKGKITHQNLSEKNPYNTYVIAGLPSNPIGLTGLDSIKAALHPSKIKALYFVATGNGDHVFSNTLQEQALAIKKYQLNRKPNYQSHPNKKW